MQYVYICLLYGMVRKIMLFKNDWLFFINSYLNSWNFAVNL